MNIRESMSEGQSGFTLLEVLMVVAVLGILSIIAVPSYQRYVNEAKAAEFLVKVHEVALVYQDIIATSPGALADHHALSSPGFGQAPSLLPGLASVFATQRGISLSSQMVNHSGYFRYTGHEAIPVLFLKADGKEGYGILQALDHVTQFKHTFVTPNIMMIALTIPHEVHTASNQPLVAVTSTTTPKPTPTPLPKPDAVPLTVPPATPGATPSVSPGAVPSLVSSTTSSGTGTATTQTGGSGGGAGATQAGASGSAATVAGSSSSGSTAAVGGTNHLNWPPGWVKHPDKHQGAHPGHH